MGGAVVLPHPGTRPLSLPSPCLHADLSSDAAHWLLLLRTGVTVVPAKVRPVSPSRSFPQADSPPPRAHEPMIKQESPSSASSEGSARAGKDSLFFFLHDSRACNSLSSQVGTGGAE